MRFTVCLLALALAACAAPAGDPGKSSAVAAAPAAPAKPACTPAPTQLVTRDIEAGKGDPIGPGSAVLVGYTGWLYDECKPDHKGEQFDTSANRQTPFGLIVGAGRVIKGWDEGLIGMKENGKRTLIIPPNATLVFEVELLGVG